MNTTNAWICDFCGGSISSIREGWVEWLRSEDRSWGFRLVHHLPASPRSDGCQYDSKRPRDAGAIVSDGPMAWYVGTDGLSELLDLMTYKGSAVEEIVDLVRRLHIPGYERARLFLDEARSEGVIDISRFRTQQEIRTVLEWADAEKVGPAPVFKEGR